MEMEIEIEFISTTEAAKRLSKVDKKKNWISWLADNRRGRNGPIKIPFDNSRRRVWYDPLHIEQFINSHLKSSKLEPGSKKVRVEQFEELYILSTRTVNDQKLIEIVGLSDCARFDVESATEFAKELVNQIKVAKNAPVIMS
jgi:hypothetical protein